MKEPADRNACHQTGQSGNALPSHSRYHHRQERKAGALHDGQPRAHGAHSDRLKQGGNAREEHRHLDHIDHHREIRGVRAKPEARRARDDDRRGYVARKHRQNMLDAQWHGFGQRRHEVRIAQLVCRADRSVCHGMSLSLLVFRDFAAL